MVLRKGNRPYTRNVHSLVLEAFVGPRPTGMQGCHFPDPDTSNNRLDNLRWDSAEANMHDCRKCGSLPVGSSVPTARLDEAKVRKIRTMIARGATQLQAAKLFGVHVTTVSLITRRKTWLHV